MIQCSLLPLQLQRRPARFCHIFSQSAEQLFLHLSPSINVPRKCELVACDQGEHATPVMWFSSSLTPRSLRAGLRVGLGGISGLPPAQAVSHQQPSLSHPPPVSCNSASIGHYACACSDHSLRPPTPLRSSLWLSLRIDPLARSCLASVPPISNSQSAPPLAIVSGRASAHFLIHCCLSVRSSINSPFTLCRTNVTPPTSLSPPPLPSASASRRRHERARHALQQPPLSRRQ